MRNYAHRKHYEHERYTFENLTYSLLLRHLLRIILLTFHKNKSKEQRNPKLLLYFDLKRTKEKNHLKSLLSKKTKQNKTMDSN